MRRLAIIFIFALLIPAPSPAMAAAKVGSKCTKVGAKVIVGNKTLVCAKNKKWQLANTKPVALPFIEKNPPEPPRLIVMTPEASSAKTIQKVSELSICLNGGRGVLQSLEERGWVDLAPVEGWERLGNCPEAWPLTPWVNAPVAIGDVLRWRIYEDDWEWFSNPFEYHPKRPRIIPAEKPELPLTSYEKVPVESRNNILSSFTYDTENTWDIKFEESIPTANRQTILETIEKTMPFVSRFLLRANEIHVIVFGTRAWGLKEVLKFDQNDQPFRKQIEAKFTTWGERPPSSCTGAGGFTIGYFEHPVIVIDAPCTNWNDGSYAVVAHELIHVAQSKWAFSLGASCLAPAWWVEGQVRSSSFAFAQANGESKWYVSRAESVRGMLNPITHPLQVFEDPFLNGEYTNGGIALEYLIARSGWEKSFQLLREADAIAGRQCLTGPRKMEVFKEAFKNVYGQSLDDFYQEVDPYLVWTWENLGRL